MPARAPKKRKQCVSCALLTLAAQAVEHRLAGIDGKAVLMLQMLVERRELVAVEVHDAPAALALKEVLSVIIRTFTMPQRRRA